MEDNHPINGEKPLLKNDENKTYFEEISKPKTPEVLYDAFRSKRFYIFAVILITILSKICEYIFAI